MDTDTSLHHGIMNTVFLQSDAAAIIFFAAYLCDYYSRVVTIQRRLLSEGGYTI